MLILCEENHWSFRSLTTFAAEWSELPCESKRKNSPYPSRHGIAHILRIVLEEVELHGFGDTQHYSPNNFQPLKSPFL